jgi:eukaryotic-like serine/threonine-protein kinase
MLGTSVGSYVITGVVGEGGMGVVYAANHTLLGRPAAIKVLLPDLSRNQDIVNRFFNEARAATSIRHPGIVEVYDFGYLPDGAAYIAMEFLDGQSLAGRLAARGALPVAEAIWLTRQVAGALAAAHAKGIVHRDLKPDNVFLIADPEVPTGERIKLLDFGIAKLTGDTGSQQKTRTGSLIGTPTYMSPEQCRGVAVDHRSDLYSLGCMLFEMLTGKPPFAGEGTGDILAAHIVAAAPAPSSQVRGVPPSVDALVLQLLAKDPAARPASCDQLIRTIDGLGPAVGRPPSFPGTAPFAKPADAATMIAPTPPPGYATRPPTAAATPPPITLATPPPAYAPPGAPTTLSGAAAAYTAPGTAPAQTGGRRGLWIGVGGAVAAAGIALAVVLAGGGSGGSDGPPAADPAAAAAPEPAPEAEPVVEPAAIAEPAPPPVAEPEPEPEPPAAVAAEPAAAPPTAPAAPAKKRTPRPRKSAGDRDRGVNPFD